MAQADFPLIQILRELSDFRARLVAVSKTKTREDIWHLYHQGQRDFGENYVQEMIGKKEALPEDIRWHFIGHLQSNKVKLIAPFVHAIHSIDSIKLLAEVQKQAEKCQRPIDCLLQVHIAREQTKFGMNEPELIQLAEEVLLHPAHSGHVRLTGLMGMATLSADKDQIREEFRGLRELLQSLQKNYFKDFPYFRELSMGMSADYRIALEEGSTLVRIGSLLFGPRA